MKRLFLLATVLLLAFSMLTGCSGSKYTCQDLIIEVPMDVQDLSEDEAYKDYTFFLQSSSYCISGMRSALEEVPSDYAYLSGFGEHALLQQGIEAEFSPRKGQSYLYFSYETEEDAVTYANVSAIYQATTSFWVVTVRYPATGYTEDFAFSFLDTVSFSNQVN